MLTEEWDMTEISLTDFLKVMENKLIMMEVSIKATFIKAKNKVWVSTNGDLTKVNHKNTKAHGKMD